MKGSRIVLALAWISVAVLWAAFQDREQDPEYDRRPLPAPRQAEASHDARAGADRARRAEAPRVTRRGASLPAPSFHDPATKVEAVPCEESCTGTAFAVDREGHWLTAQHVINGCVQVGLLTAPYKIERVQRVVEHPSADLAALWTGQRVPELALAGIGLSRDQVGYAFGYPKGQPGSVHGKLIGRIRLKVTGNRRFTSPAIAWAEVRRVPDSLPALGGLSGGPMLDASGAIVGVAVAASRRRGRVISASPASIEELIDQVGWRPARASAEDLARTEITPASFADYGDSLRSSLAVARVVCIGERKLRRRRSSLF